MPSSSIFFDQIFAHLADGGSLTAWCRAHKKKYSVVIAAIAADLDLQKKYELAIAARTEWAVETALAEIRLIMSADVRQLYHPDGTIKSVDEWPESIARAVAAVEVDEISLGSGTDRRVVGQTKKIKLWDKIKSLELAMRNLSLLIEQHDHSVHGTVTLMPEIKIEDRPLRFDLGSPN
jgi:phage terminase small subunit